MDRLTAEDLWGLVVVLGIAAALKFAAYVSDASADERQEALIFAGTAGLWLSIFVLFAWDTKFLLSLRFDVDWGRISSKPHDCDFWTAPMGVKHCDYEPSVYEYQGVRFLEWEKPEE